MSNSTITVLTSALHNNRTYNIYDKSINIVYITHNTHINMQYSGNP